MSRKRKELPVLEGVEIIDVAAEGNALARVNDMVVFVPFGAPGDVADVKLDRKKSSYAEGHIERMIKPSAIRETPRCEHFGICGGCRWQHLPYEFQLQCKQKQVKDALERIAKIPFPEITPILGSESIWEYRNKMEYTFSSKMWLTFDQLRSGEAVPLVFISQGLLIKCSISTPAICRMIWGTVYAGSSRGSARRKGWSSMT